MRVKLKSVFFALVLWLIRKRDGRNKANTGFPNSRGENYLFDPLFPDETGEAYFTCLNMEPEENPLSIDFSRFRYEVVKGKRYEAGKEHRIRIDEPCALPCSITGVDITRIRGPYRIDLTCNGEEIPLRRLLAERFYYLPIREPADLVLKSDQDIVIGEPIALKQQTRNKAPFALMIFIDSFTWQIMERLSFEDDLPNISRFFSKGTVFENAFSSSNWTIPSIASVFSGKTITNHKMFHPREDIVLGDGYPVISEIFKRAGYLTFQACGNHRKTPSYGYAKGFDRTIYRYRATIGEIVESSLAQLRSFPDRDQFHWLSIFDAHTPIALTHDISIQMALPLEAQDYHQQDAKSPMQLEPNAMRTLRYIEELKKIDFNLGRLFDYVEDTFGDDALVCLLADHGTSFTTPDQKMLSPEKTHIALMMRGPQIAAARAPELVHQTDILPCMLRSAGLSLNSEIDGQLPAAMGGTQERDHVVSDILYPGTTRKIVIRDHEFEFHLESEGIVDSRGEYELGDYSYALYRRSDSLTEITSDEPETAERFRTMALEKLAA